ncbi:hypothetical protein DL96DRAFT_540028 [Flagelloscypha sp. PMI_526]|nr:hypothetical protein DL96DRAFT_540028 [Flagelloscypha sp. PMI_526]
MDFRLPDELERTIFIIAATSDDSLIAPLLLVAQRVKGWIEPLRFRSLVIETCEFLQVRHSGKHLQKLDLEQRICWLALGKPAEFLAQHVKFVQIGAEINHLNTIVPFLSLMSTLTNMAIWSILPNNPFPDLSAFGDLTYLSLNLTGGRDFCNFLLDHPGYIMRVTHMEFVYNVVAKLLPLINSQLPYLSHFCVIAWWYSKNKDALLDAFNRLLNLDQMVVVVISVTQKIAITSDIAGVYPILSHPKVTLKTFSGLKGEWTLRVEGKPDIWTRRGALDGE